MITRKQNETFYQNNSIELNDEALEAVLGGCGDSWEGNQCQQNYGGNQCQQNYGDGGYGHDNHNCGGILRVLGCLL